VDLLDKGLKIVAQRAPGQVRAFESAIGTFKACVARIDGDMSFDLLLQREATASLITHVLQLIEHLRRVERSESVGDEQNAHIQSHATRADEAVMKLYIRAREERENRLRALRTDLRTVILGRKEFYDIVGVDIAAIDKLLPQLEAHNSHISSVKATADTLDARLKTSAGVMTSQELGGGFKRERTIQSRIAWTWTSVTLALLGGLVCLVWDAITDPEWAKGIPSGDYGPIAFVALRVSFTVLALTLAAYTGRHAAAAFHAQQAASHRYQIALVYQNMVQLKYISDLEEQVLSAVLAVMIQEPKSPYLRDKSSGTSQSAKELESLSNSIKTILEARKNA